MNVVSSEETERLIEAIDVLTKEFGYPPTFEELATHMGLKKTTVYARMRRLKAQDKVTWHTYNPRTIQTT